MPNLLFRAFTACGTLGSIVLIVVWCSHRCVTAAPPVAQESGAGDETEISADTVAGNSQVAEIIRTFAGRGVMADDSQPTDADRAVAQFEMRDDLSISLVVAEPIISQPLHLSWDSRGRMWVVEYRQYQFPAGLRVIRYDQHLRAVFNRQPDPPPLGTKGADRISVHQDTDGDGVYDEHKVVIDGLNIATSVAVGRGGIWVLQPPYLLFYPDRDRDDVPDGDPEVRLSGFGLQDTHAVANNLMWGPDGWLYGVTGSTTTSDISSAVTKGVRFEGQSVWRYHPETEVFEIYAQGGGNTFSLEIDSVGRVFAGTNGGDTRGWYFPQGSYSEKNWGKHGPLTNPYAFGFFKPMGFQGDGRRFPQAFNIYEGGLFPERDAGTIIASNAMHNLIWNSERIREGSTYRTVDRELIARSPDRWFRPVYNGVGPDGAVYVADWYDTRLSHVSPVDDWHKSSGRIYRIAPTDPSSKDSSGTDALGDLHHATSDQLINYFDHPNKWVRRRATLELGWRGDRSVMDRLIHRVDDQACLESLWAINGLGGLSDSRITLWLSHHDVNIRRWVVRLLGDQKPRDEWSGAYAKLADMAAGESDVQVRSQLASTAARVPAETAMAIIAGLTTHDSDVSDPHMPLLIWWALEAHVGSWPDIESMLNDRALWQRPIFSEHLISRLMQRYVASASTTDLISASQLYNLAPDESSQKQLMVGLQRAFEGRSIPPLSPSLAKALRDYQLTMGDDGLVLGIRRGDRTIMKTAIELLENRKTELGQRIAISEAIAGAGWPEAVKPLIRLATGSITDEPSLQRVAIRCLSAYDDDAIAPALIGAFGSRLSTEHDLRSTACRTLASRPAWARRLLNELTSWRLRREDIPTDVVQQLRGYQDPDLSAAVEQVFGPPPETASPERLAEIRRLREMLSTGHGDSEKGKQDFIKSCGVCHQLFGDGQRVGPPLDGYQRGDISFWVNAIVEPSLEIREGYQPYLVLTVDGRIINGMITAQDSQSVTLRDAQNQTVVLDRNDIDELHALSTSLMPGDLLRDWSDQRIRDLIAYLSLGT